MASDHTTYTMSLKDNATWKAVKPFLNGGLSGMGATCIIQPLDIVKVRLARFGGSSSASSRDEKVWRRLGRDAASEQRRARLLARLGIGSRRAGAPPPASRTRPTSFELAPPVRPTPRSSRRFAFARLITGGPFAVAGGIIKNDQLRRSSTWCVSSASPSIVPKRNRSACSSRHRRHVRPLTSRIIRTRVFGTPVQGLSAGLLRQATYTTARLGIHAKIVDFLKEIKTRGAPPPGPESWRRPINRRAAASAPCPGSPADLSLIRMQADGTLPAAERRDYTGVMHALSDIVSKEGVGGLFVGASTTAVRAMALNMGMLASNDQAKEMMKDNGITGFPATLGASAIAGFFASFFSLPFDYVKTQLQKQKPLPDGSMPFKGFGDCVAKTMASGGPLKFYTGFPTYYVRIAPHAMFTLIILDQINATQKSLGM